MMSFQRAENHDQHEFRIRRVQSWVLGAWDGVRWLRGGELCSCQRVVSRAGLSGEKWNHCLVCYFAMLQTVLTLRKVATHIDRKYTRI